MSAATPSPAAIRAALACAPAYMRGDYEAGHPSTVELIHGEAAKIDTEFKPLADSLRGLIDWFWHRRPKPNVRRDYHLMVQHEAARAALPDYTPPATKG